MRITYPTAATGKRGSKMANIYGDEFNNTLTGTSDADYISAGGGRDVLSGLGGNDILRGGNGSDRLTGGAQNDTLSGGYGADRFFFSESWGQDIIDESQYDYYSGGDTIEHDLTDTLVFEDITEDEVTFTRDGGDLYIEAGDAADNVRIEDYYNGYQSYYLFQFKPPSASISVAANSANDDEGSGSATAFTFTVTRSDDTSSAVGASYAVTGSGSSPANAADFAGGVLPSGTVSFAAGETSKTITVNVAGDTTFEPSETFTLTLSNSTNGAVLGTASASGTITNDDTQGPVATNGNDNLTGTPGDDRIDALGGNDTVRAGGGSDTVLGGTGNDTLYGEAGNDTVEGKDGADKLAGDAGNDTIRGGKGKDLLYSGAGTDEFELDAANESLPGSANRDTAQDWAKGDKFDIASIGFNGASSTAKFKFVGKSAVDDPGEVGFTTSGGSTVIRGGTDGDSAAEFEILIPRTVTLVASDFIL